MKLHHAPATEPRALLLSAILLLAGARTARAENDIAYRYEDYRESGGRVAVQTQGTLIESNLGADLKAKLGGVLDAIAGATPTGEPAPTGSNQVVLTNLVDRRKAWNLEVSRQFPRVNVAVGAANSRESDYVSTGFSVNTLTDFNQKNTTLLAGFAWTNDAIKTFYYPYPQAKKHTEDLIVGVHQLLDPNTALTLNLTWGRATGYLSDQHKLVQKSLELIPGFFIPQTYVENRPGERNKWIALGSLNRAFPTANGALEGTYRLYHDTFGTTSHLVDLSWLQRLGSRVVVQPMLRWYQQSAADFYHYDLDQTSIEPSGIPSPDGPFYSSDHRLSALRTVNVGVKATWKVGAGVELGASLTRYRMTGRDGVTPQSAYSRATTAGGSVKWSW